MYKNIISNLIFVVLLFSVFGYASAEPITYKFVGSVNRIFNGNPEIVDGIIAVGDSVEFTFECDQEKDGYTTYYNGYTLPSPDRDYGSSIADYFWCDYVGGTVIGAGEITSPSPSATKEWNVGLAVFRFNDAGEIIQRTSYLYGGSAYDWRAVENYSQNINDWQVGKGDFQLWVKVRNQANQFTWIRGPLVLTSVSGPQQTDPLEEIQNLINVTLQLIALDDLSESDTNKLINVLSDAAKLIEFGNTNAAIDKLNNFIRKVERYLNRGKISDIHGMYLIDAANLITQQLLL